MARKFVSFGDFSKERKPIDEASNTAQAKLDARNKVTEVKNKMAQANQAGDELAAQILEIDMKMAQLDVQKTDLQAQKDHLTQAKAIADKNKQSSEEAKK